MQHISGMTAEQVQEEYGYPDLRMADAIRNRSTGENPVDHAALQTSELGLAYFGAGA